MRCALGPLAGSLLMLASLSSGSARSAAYGEAPPAAAPSAAARPGAWKRTITLRSRLEVYDFFDPGNLPVGSQNSYSFFANLLKVGWNRSGKKRDVGVEVAVPMLLNLPDDAVAPAPFGQLGLGGSYRSASGEQDISVFVRQAHVTFKDVTSLKFQLKLGRFEFIDGVESLTQDPTLDWIKKERISHRLIGNFGFTHIQRAFDGVQATRNTTATNITAFAGRPTAGVFDLDAMNEISDVDVAYGAITHKGGPRTWDGRLFALNYRDERPVLKTDNRALAARRADRGAIDVTTLGGHLTRKLGNFDGLLWGAIQRGDWGRLDHRASAYDMELGYQPRGSRLKPWIRTGLSMSSGDPDPKDGSQRTFFQVLPTPRIYARYPFFNMMNLEDQFVEIILRPKGKNVFRASYHDLRLDEATDLWYAGGGAFQSQSFGYLGRPASGHHDLAELTDLSVDHKVSDRTSLTLYLAHADGGAVISSIYPGDSADFAYVEASHKF